MFFSDIIESVKRAGKTKRWLLVLAPVLLVLLLVPKETYAQIPLLGLLSFGNITFIVIGKVVFGITWIISMLGGIIVALVAWILGFLLQINTGIASSPPVKIGFPITLAFANLCFVLAIIVIAVATIVRFQSYGVKQALWRLVVIAILVNFGLVIANSILVFSDSLATYFLAGVDPASSVGGATNGISSFNNFASALAGAFNPQHWTNPLATSPSGIGDDAAGVLSNIGGSIGSLVFPIASMFFSIFALIFIIVTLGALVVMLIIRYVKLGYLLIILPVAWAGFIFPHTRKYWSNWWDGFLKNAFFTPIALFFLWLTMQVAISMGSQDAYQISLYKSPSNPVWAGISGLFTNMLTPLVSGFLQLSVLLGLMIGGLIAAQNFGFGIAGAAKGLALGAAYGLGKWSKRKGIQGGTALANKARIGTAAKELQSGTGFWGKGLNRLTLGGSSRLGGLMQHGMVMGTEGQVQDAGKRLGNLSNEELTNRMGRSTAAERMFIMDKLNKEGKLNDIPNLERYLGGDSKNGDNAKLWQRFNLGKTFSALKAESGVQFTEAIETQHRAEAGGTDEEKAAARLAVAEAIRKIKNPANLANALIKDARSMTSEDLSKIPGLAGKNETQVREFQQAYLRGMVEHASGSAFGKMISGLESGEQVQAFKNIAGDSGITQEMINNGAVGEYAKNSAAKSLGFNLGWLGNGLTTARGTDEAPGRFEGR
ncbi:MAG TPA: hypothetical protein VJL32_02890, partial [Candidatus Paceibacterota bacterium]